MSAEDVPTIDPSLTLSLRPEEDQDELSESIQAFRLIKIGKDVLVYGGDDGVLQRAADQTMVRKWDEDAIRAMAVSPHERTVAVGFDTGELQIYDFENYAKSSDESEHPFCAAPADHPDADDAFMSQSDTLSSPRPNDKWRQGPSDSTPVRDVLFLNDAFLVIATEAGLTIVNLKDADMPEYLRDEVKKEHDGAGVRGLSWNASIEMLTTVGLDGSVCFWKCPLSDPNSWKVWKKEANIKVLKKDVGEFLGADPWDRSTRPCQQDAHLAIPGARAWQLLEWSSGSEVEYRELFQNDTVHQSSSTVLHCARGSQWISTDRAGVIALWRLDSEKMKEQSRLRCGKGSAPTDVLWTDERLWIITADGRILVWKTDVLPKPVETTPDDQIIAAEDDEVQQSYETTITEPVPKDASPAPVRRRLLKAGDPDGNNQDDDDDDDIDFSQPTNRFVEDQAIEDNDDDDVIQPETGNKPSANDNDDGGAMGDNGNDDDGDDDDDENSFDMDQFPAPTRHAPTAWAPPAVEPQAAFGPSSTSLEDPRRFLCWNQVGAMTVRETDPGRSTVDIDFTDAAFRRPISFTDTIGFILGSLGEEGAILASDVPDDDDDEDNDLGDVVDGLQISETTRAALKKDRRKKTSVNGSTIYFRRYETFANKRDKDWYLTLPAGERVLGCATGQGWAAVVTHRRFLRLFTPGGNQGQILWIDGDPVTMVGRSRLLAVVYHQSAPLTSGTQKMGYTLFDAVSGRVVTKGSLSCLSSRSTLQWVGFSSDLTLMAMDSDGMLSMLVSSAEVAAAHWEWMPVLDTVALRKSTEDTHWPVHVSDGKLICVPLRGGVKYPDAARRPVTTALGLRLPLARGPLTHVHAVEELSVRAAVSLHQRRAVRQITFPRTRDDDDDDEEFAREYRTLSAQVDKVTLKLFASLAEAGKLERAFDLTERLHLERSFEVAMKMADRHRKLVDKIEEARDVRFPPEDEDDEEDEYDAGHDARPEVTTTEPAFPRISPDASTGRHPKRTFGSWDAKGHKARRIS